MTDCKEMKQRLLFLKKELEDIESEKKFDDKICNSFITFIDLELKRIGFYEKISPVILQGVEKDDQFKEFEEYIFRITQHITAMMETYERKPKDTLPQSKLSWLKRQEGTTRYEEYLTHGLVEDIKNAKKETEKLISQYTNLINHDKNFKKMYACLRDEVTLAKLCLKKLAAEEKKEKREISSLEGVPIPL